MGHYKLIIKNGILVTPFELIPNGVLAIDDKGKIAYVGSEKNFSGSADEEFDAKGGYIAPGFIDIHIHGSAGVDTMDGKYESLNKMSKFLAQQGVTAFYPTTVTSAWEDIYKALDAVREAIEKGVDGAKVIKAHLEGPYFSKEKAGAQDVRYLRTPNLNEVKDLLKKYGDIIGRITLAPELPGALEVIKYLTENGIVVALGHTNATYEQAIAAFDAGAKIANHIYNGMRAFHHREPGIVGASLTRDDVYAEMIVDQVHHHNAARKIVIRCKGTDKTLLITDAIMAAGLPDGEYVLGRQKIIIKNGISRLPDGTLAGSTLTMINAVKNTINYLNVGLQDAIKMASYVPAKVMGLDGEKGVLKLGFDADAVVLSKELDVLLTIVEGNVVYRKQ